MSQQQESAALSTVEATASAINNAKEQLTPKQLHLIMAVKAIYIVATMQSPGGVSVTNRGVQRVLKQELNIKFKLGTFVLNGSTLQKATVGYWASAFVHEGVHIVHHEWGTPFREHRAYHEQYKASHAFGLTQYETDFVKAQCGDACH